MSGRTRVTRELTKHMGQPLASVVFEARMTAARLSGGGLLEWEQSGGVGNFKWGNFSAGPPEDLYIEFPTVGSRLRILPGETTAVLTAGDAVYVEVPYVIGDDIAEGETAPWIPAVPPVVPMLYGKPPEDEKYLVVGVFGADGKLYLRDYTVLSPGFPQRLGGAFEASDRGIILSTGATTYTLPFYYVPGVRQLEVYVNGVIQVPAARDGIPALGYADFAGGDAHWKEQWSGSPPGPEFADQVEFHPSYVPAAGEIIVVKSNAGAQGPPAGPGVVADFTDVYDSGRILQLADLAGEQLPVEIKEDPNLPYAGNDEMTSAQKPGMILARRSVNTPTAALQDSPATFWASSGDMGLGSLFLFNPRRSATIQSEIDGTSPNPDDGLALMTYKNVFSAPTSDGKIAFAILRRALFSGLSWDELPYWRQDNPTLQIGMDGGVNWGLVAINKQGEIATGRGADYLRWYIIELVLPVLVTPPTVQDLVPIPFDDQIVDLGAILVGGSATVTWAYPEPTPTETRYEIFHANPSLVYAGENPRELLVWVSDSYPPGSGPRELNVRYGSSLGGQTIRIVLFFSSEYQPGDEF